MDPVSPSKRRASPSTRFPSPRSSYSGPQRRATRSSAYIRYVRTPTCVALAARCWHIHTAPVRIVGQEQLGAWFRLGRALRAIRYHTRLARDWGHFEARRALAKCPTRSPTHRSARIERAPSSFAAGASRNLAMRSFHQIATQSRRGSTVRPPATGCDRAGRS